jgi:hypothetical protein
MRVSSEPVGPGQPGLAGEELARAQPAVLNSALRVRVFDRRGKVVPAAKRRGRAPSSLLADLTDPEVLGGLSAALRRDRQVMDWMSWPDLWFEFIDEHGVPLAALGLLGPEWVRWDPHGDLQLAAPDSLGAWLSAHQIQGPA